jgi:hypothetical protein
MATSSGRHLQKDRGNKDSGMVRLSHGDWHRTFDNNHSTNVKTKAATLCHPVSSIPLSVSVRVGGDRKPAEPPRGRRASKQTNQFEISAYFASLTVSVPASQQWHGWQYQVVQINIPVRLACCSDCCGVGYGCQISETATFQWLMG